MKAVSLAKYFTVYGNLYDSAREELIRMCSMSFIDECGKRGVQVEQPTTWTPTQSKVRECPCTLNGLFPGVFKKKKNSHEETNQVFSGSVSSSTIVMCRFN